MVLIVLYAGMKILTDQARERHSGDPFGCQLF